ncbi:MAG: hydroxyacylglutathione hydrolase [Alphaproteobacteria bacterium]|nr:MAG: hydroxyacylglutathione hydrolase [Alphaproteobacteria bacterium]
MSKLAFHQYPCLSDNYGVLVHDVAAGETFAVDVPDADATLAALAATGWKLTHILVTHHHDDHIQGIPAVKAATACVVIGPAGIAAVDRAVAGGDVVDLAGEGIRVIATPGHTLDMLNYFLPGARVLFAGDTLFAMGCGRVFEGTPAQMWASLEKLMALPADTMIYCGHEYTLANGRFALTVDGGNAALVARMKEVEALRGQGRPTLPTVLDLELATNPFLRAADPAIRAGLGMDRASDAEVFAELRERKNRG